jgi:hypothetical protein
VPRSPATRRRGPTEASPAGTHGLDEIAGFRPTRDRPSGRGRASTRGHGTASADVVDAQLSGIPISPDLAARPASEGGVPSEPGFYAWWTNDYTTLRAPPRPHPTERGWSLLCVAISPARASSSQNLRGRVLNNHLGGNTGSSTFRLTLAALLCQQQGWCPVRRATRVLLTAEDNRALSAWQRSNLALTWTRRAEPWEIEHDVIARMQPPLNLAANASHPFHSAVHGARASFRRAAGEA